MKHKHAEVIKAFVDGIECEYWSQSFDEWQPITSLCPFLIEVKVRIKPEPKPDFIAFIRVYPFIKDTAHTTNAYFKKETYDNLMVTFDGETNELKDAKVIK